jgi:hypothetical protein
MQASQVMPLVMTVESFCAAAICAYNREWNHALYWLGSTLLLGSVAYLHE